ncbi:MAG: hypothetical protein IJ735_07755 [Clostridia bacterium]|nr:hypothetical protein [Clostridia bacterium]
MDTKQKEKKEKAEFECYVLTDDNKRLTTKDLIELVVDKFSKDNNFSQKRKRKRGEKNEENLSNKVVYMFHEWADERSALEKIKQKLEKYECKEISEHEDLKFFNQYFKINKIIRNRSKNKTKDASNDNDKKKSFLKRILDKIEDVIIEPFLQVVFSLCLGTTSVASWIKELFSKESFNWKIPTVITSVVAVLSIVFIVLVKHASSRKKIKEQKDNFIIEIEEIKQHYLKKYKKKRIEKKQVFFVDAEVLADEDIKVIEALSKHLLRKLNFIIKKTTNLPIPINDNSYKSDYLTILYQSLQEDVKKVKDNYPKEGTSIIVLVPLSNLEKQMLHSSLRKKEEPLPERYKYYGRDYIYNSEGGFLIDNNKLNSYIGYVTNEIRGDFYQNITYNDALKLAFLKFLWSNNDEISDEIKDLLHIKANNDVIGKVWKQHSADLRRIGDKLVFSLATKERIRINNPEDVINEVDITTDLLTVVKDSFSIIKVYVEDKLTDAYKVPFYLKKGLAINDLLRSVLEQYNNPNDKINKYAEVVEFVVHYNYLAGYFNENDYLLRLINQLSCTEITASKRFDELLKDSIIKKAYRLNAIVSPCRSKVGEDDLNSFDLHEAYLKRLAKIEGIEDKYSNYILENGTKIKDILLPPDPLHIFIDEEYYKLLLGVDSTIIEERIIEESIVVSLLKEVSNIFKYNFNFTLFNKENIALGFTALEMIDLLRKSLTTSIYNGLLDYHCSRSDDARFIITNEEYLKGLMLCARLDCDLFYLLFDLKTFLSNLSYDKSGQKKGYKHFIHSPLYRLADHYVFVEYFTKQRYNDTFTNEVLIPIVNLPSSMVFANYLLRIINQHDVSQRNGKSMVEYIDNIIKKDGTINIVLPEGNINAVEGRQLLCLFYNIKNRFTEESYQRIVFHHIKELLSKVEDSFKKECELFCRYVLDYPIENAVDKIIIEEMQSFGENSIYLILDAYEHDVEYTNWIIDKIIASIYTHRIIFLIDKLGIMSDDVKQYAYEKINKSIKAHIFDERIHIDINVLKRYHSFLKNIPDHSNEFDQNTLEKCEERIMTYNDREMIDLINHSSHLNKKEMLLLDWAKIILSLSTYSIREGAVDDQNILLQDENRIFINKKYVTVLEEKAKTQSLSTEEKQKIKNDMMDVLNAPKRYGISISSEIQEACSSFLEGV